MMRRRRENLVLLCLVVVFIPVTADAVSCQRRRGSNLERALAGNDLGADEDEEDEDAKA